MVGSKRQSMIKKNFFVDEISQLQKENQDLKASIQINKELLSEILGKSDTKLKNLIQKNYWDLEGQILVLRKERDSFKDQCLIKDQIIEELKNQEAITVEQYEEQINELKENLDRKEYGIQYKEQIWSTFERELKKAIKKDSELYKKIQNTTQIMVENLNETRVSNVVKQNFQLLNDQKHAKEQIDHLLASINSLSDEEVWFGDRHMNINFYEYEQNISTERQQQIPYFISDFELSSKIQKLKSIVEQIKNKYSILSEENNFLRQEYAKVSRINLQQQKEIEDLQNQFKLELKHQRSSNNYLMVQSSSSTKQSSCQLSHQNLEEQENQVNTEELNNDSNKIPEGRNSEENIKHLFVKLQSMSPSKRTCSASIPEEHNQFCLVAQVNDFEFTLNKFMCESPEGFKRQRIQRSKTGCDLSVIHQQHHVLSPCSPIEFTPENLEEQLQ